MQRGLTIVLGVAVVVLAVLLALKSAPRAPDGIAATDASVAGDAGRTADAGAFAAEDASMQALFGDDLTIPPAPSVDGGFHMADGTPIPPLGDKTPKRVRFGVILVAYEGAQGAPAHGPRSRREALAMAQKLAEDARSDFKGAVERGDNGSSDDMGTVPRGVLEGAPEAVLFELPPGGTSGVVDTPRGYWIVKRLE